MKSDRLLVATCVLLLVVLAPGAGINRSVHVEANAAIEGDQSTLNGSITIEDGATVRGECESVNGPIRVGRDAQVESISAVNGSITIGEGTIVDKEVSAVNGPITLDRGSRAGEVETVNGPIRLDGAKVDGDVSTVNGLLRFVGSTVGGNVVIENRGQRGWSWKQREPQRIELEDGTVIRGDVINESDRVRVELYLRGGSRVEGRIVNVEVIED